MSLNASRWCWEIFDDNDLMKSFHQLSETNRLFMGFRACLLKMSVGDMLPKLEE